MENQLCNECNGEGKYIYCKGCWSDDETSSIFTEKEKIICGMCDKEIDDFSDGYFTCDGCYEHFCWGCKEEFIEDELCRVADCFYCRDGSCFNNRTINHYCDDCVPEEVADEIKRREDELVEIELMWKGIQSTKSARKKQLIEKLHIAGLELRSDSKLCKRYIEQEIGDVDDIIERMCQMKFLYEYNNMKSILDKVENEYYEICNAGYFPDFEVFPEAERLVLEKIKEYPKVYPWQLDRYTRIIQKGCENWLWKPVCKDGKLGIHAKLMMKHVEQSVKNVL